MQPTASVIIVTYNSQDQISACLAALTSDATAVRAEVVVVDNASSDATVALIEDRYPAVRIMQAPDNQGFAAAVNQGVAASRSTCIALLNPDAEPVSGWLAALTDPLIDPELGVTGGKVLGADDRLQSVGADLRQPVLLPAARGADEIDRGQWDAPADVWSAHGAAMAFRRDVWAAVGGFDAGFFPAYLEESDFCERVRRAGYRVRTAPRAVVRHQEATTTGKGSAQFLWYFLRNRLRYAAKWLAWDDLWHSWRPAEHARLRQVGLVERRVARLVYAGGVPSLDALSPAEQQAVLRMGQALRERGVPDDGYDPLLAFAAEANANSVHLETPLSSRLPAVGALRAAWNNIATRWYVRPNLDQQTRYNLALQHAAHALVEQVAADAAAAALDSALLAWRLEQR